MIPKSWVYLMIAAVIVNVFAAGVNIVAGNWLFAPVHIIIAAILVYQYVGFKRDGRI